MGRRMADTVDALKCWVEQKALKKKPWKKKINRGYPEKDAVRKKSIDDTLYHHRTTRILSHRRENPRNLT